MFRQTLEPIELPDDGLRVALVKQTSNGTKVIHQHNPTHLATHMAERARRKAIQNLNFRRFS